MTGKKIKVALFSEVLKENLDGVTHTLYNIIERVPKDKFEYILITPLPPSPHVKLPFPVVVVPKVPFPLHQDYPVALPYFNKKLKKVLEEFKPDLIHLTTPFTLGVYALRYGKANNIPVLSTYHTHFISYIEYYFRLVPLLPKFIHWAGWKFLRWFYNRCDKTYVPTTSIIEELVDAGIEEDRLILWGRGVNRELFNPKRKDSEFMAKLAGKGTKRILFVSRLVWEKELRTLINIYKYFKDKRPDIKIVITGSGPKEGAVKKEMPDAIFTGKLIKEELAKVYASSDVFVFPSITETFGNVVLEALASGLPAVVAAKGGPKGIVKDGVTGFHVEPRNVQEFCNNLLKIIDDNELHAKMSRAASDYAETQKWDSLCDNMFSSYEEILLDPSGKENVRK